VIAVLSLATFFALLVPSISSADTTFSTDGALLNSTIPSACSGNTSGMFVSGNQYKIRANLDLAITAISFQFSYLSNFYGTHAGNMVKILSDSSGQPGSALASLVLIGDPSPNTVGTYASSTPIRLRGGTSYWVEIDDNSACAVLSGPLTFTGSAITAMNPDGTPLGHFFSGTDVSTSPNRYQFAIYGTLAINTGGGVPLQTSSVKTATMTCDHTITISGAFDAPLSNISLNNLMISPSMYTQTKSSITISRVPHSADSFSIQLYNGQMPLAPISVDYPSCS
jgi:hypothetical protein